MNPTHIRALEYIQNTNYGATLEDFKVDWEPIGNILWKDLLEDKLVLITNAGKVALTPQGKTLLKEKQDYVRT